MTDTTTTDEDRAELRSAADLCHCGHVYGWHRPIDGKHHGPCLHPTGSTTEDGCTGFRPAADATEPSDLPDEAVSVIARAIFDARTEAKQFPDESYDDWRQAHAALSAAWPILRTQWEKDR